MCYPSVNELWKNLYKSLVLLLYGNHYCTQKDAPEENVYEVDQELGVGESSPSAYKRVGNEPQLQIPSGKTRGAWQQVKLNHAL